MSSNIGPKLPPHLLKKKKRDEDSGSDSDDGIPQSSIGPRLPPQANIGPRLPPQANIGPQLPPHLEKKEHAGKGDGKKNVAGPQLPPHLLATKGESDDDGDGSEGEDVGAKHTVASSYGPSLPPGYSQSVSGSGSIGPQLPPGMRSSSTNNDDDDDDDEDDGYGIVGPMLPPTSSGSGSDVKAAFEARAKAMKNKLTGVDDDSKELKRETWMTELPPEFSKNFGVGARTFRTKAHDCGDRSVWTDTPADRERKRQEAAEAAKKARDAPPPQKKKKEEEGPTAEELELQASVAEYNQANRPKSLLEMHRAKNAGKTDDGVRKPFDRSRDLSLHRKDPKQVDQFIKGAKGMTDKFSSGTYSTKFL